MTKVASNIVALAAICFCLLVNNVFAGDIVARDRVQRIVPKKPADVASPITLPNGTVGTSYSFTLPSYDALDPTLMPPGLNVMATPNGIETLAGTPTQAGQFSFSIDFVPYAITIADANDDPPLMVNVTDVGGTATVASFNLKLASGTKIIFAGPATAKQTFSLTNGEAYVVSEASTLTSANYTTTLSAGCIGTMTKSGATCTVTNTFVTPNPTPTPTPSNLILNPTLTLDNVTPGTPDDWNYTYWGTVVPTFKYPVSACGGTGAEVTFATASDGAAEYYPNLIPATPNTNYVFTDSYSASAATSVTMQFTSTDTPPVLSYLQIATAPATTGSACGTANGSFTTPGNVAFMTPLHTISAAGSLTITNESLTLVSGTTSGAFSKGLLTIRIDDGLESSFVNGGPVLDAAGIPASWYIISNEAAGALETIFPSVDNPLTSGSTATTSTSVTWSDIYPDPTQTQFEFSDTYTAKVPSTFTVTYTAASNNAQTSLTIGTAPAGTNATATFTFSIPVGAIAASTPLSFEQKLTGSGTLTASNPLLTETIGGYMSAAQVLARQAKGDEIGDHTVNHCNLLTLLANPASATIDPSLPGAGCPDTGPLAAPSTAAQQIDNARTALINLGATPVGTFAYPYGDGAGNATIEGLVQTDGMIAASSVNAGYNVKSTDPYNLSVQIVDITVTDPATATAWIDYAVKNKVWLILLFHNIETSAATLTTLGEVDGTTTAIFQTIVNYAAQQKAAGNLIVDTVYNVMTKYVNQ